MVKVISTNIKPENPHGFVNTETLREEVCFRTWTKLRLSSVHVEFGKGVFFDCRKHITPGYRAGRQGTLLCKKINIGYL